MNLPFFIARRYLFARKSHHAINIISAISAIGIGVVTAALIVVLSVFNGFENLVETLFNTFNPDLLIESAEGKTFDIREIPLVEIEKIPGVYCVSKIIEENALVRYGQNQQIITLKGVDENFKKRSRLDTMMLDGQYRLTGGNTNYAVYGVGVEGSLAINRKNISKPLWVYVPNRDAGFSVNPENAFNSEAILPAGCFSVQQDFDSRYVIVPLRFAQKILNYPTELTSLEIALKPNAKTDDIHQKISRLLGVKFTVKNRYQQQELLYKVMHSEKMAIYLIVTFILIIAAFNVMSSLSMLIFDKRKDIAIFQSLGATNSEIRKIYLYEGLLLSLSGGLGGLFSGGIICWIQQSFGIVKLNTGNGGSFVVDAYPVLLQGTDFMMVFGIVMLIGFCSVWFTVRRISGKYLYERL